MGKILLSFILMFSVVSAWAETKKQELTYGELKARLLLHAESDLYEVETYPEFRRIFDDSSKVDLKLTQFEQPRVPKGTFLRVAYVRSYDIYNIKDSKEENTVYNVTLEVLDENLYPTGTQIKVGAKSKPGNTVSNFTQVKDQLGMSPTLITGRARVGDHLINAMPTVIDGKKVPSYSKFEIIGITSKYRPFTISWNYTLTIKNVRTGSIQAITAPGLTSLPNWAHLVAPKNQRIIKLRGMEIHY